MSSLTSYANAVRIFQVVIGVVNPWSLLVLVPVAPLFVFVRSHYLKSSRQIKRLDGVSRSPIYAHFSAALRYIFLCNNHGASRHHSNLNDIVNSGLSSIRAFKAEKQFADDFNRLIDVHTHTALAYLTTTRWLGARLDFISSSVVFATGLAAVATKVTFILARRAPSTSDHHVTSVGYFLVVGCCEPKQCRLCFSVRVAADCPAAVVCSAIR